VLRRPRARGFRSAAGIKNAQPARRSGARGWGRCGAELGDPRPQGVVAPERIAGAGGRQKGRVHAHAHSSPGPTCSKNGSFRRADTGFRDGASATSFTHVCPGEGQAASGRWPALGGPRSTPGGMRSRRYRPTAVALAPPRYRVLVEIRSCPHYLLPSFGRHAYPRLSVSWHACLSDIAGPGSSRPGSSRPRVAAGRWRR